MMCGYRRRPGCPIWNIVPESPVQPATGIPDHAKRDDHSHIRSHRQSLPHSTQPGSGIHRQGRLNVHGSGQENSEIIYKACYPEGSRMKNYNGNLTALEDTLYDLPTKGKSEYQKVPASAEQFDAAKKAADKAGVTLDSQQVRENYAEAWRAYREGEIQEQPQWDEFAKQIDKELADGDYFYIEYLDPEEPSDSPASRRTATRRIVINTKAPR